MSELYYLIRKNIKLIFKSRFIIVQLLAPVAVTLLILKLFSGMSGNIHYGVVDKDKSVGSNFIITNSETSRSKVEFYDDEEDLKKDIQNRDIEGGFVVPEEFEENLIKGQEASIDIYIGEDNNLKKTLQASVDDRASTLKQIAQGALGDKEIYLKIIEESKNKTINVEEARLDDKTSEYQVSQISIGLLIFFMMLRANSTSQIMIDEKRSNCYSRIFASPVTPFKFIGANVISNLVVIIIQAIITLVSMRWILKLETDIPFSVLLLFLVLISLVAVAFSTMIVTAVKDYTSGTIISNLVINISCMISGCYIPIEFIPENIRNIAYIFPQRWVMDIFLKYQTGDVTINNLYINIITLLAFALTLLLIASLKVKFSNKEMSAIKG